MTAPENNFDLFLEKIANLDVEVSSSGEGIFTACSLSEPCFCFDGHSQAEVADRVVDTLESYARLYFGLNDLKLRSHREDLKEPTVKLETVTPLSKLGLAVA